MLAGLFRYIDQHFHTPDNFVANSRVLVDDDKVRKRIFDGFTDEIDLIVEGATAIAAPPAEGADSTSPRSSRLDDKPDPVTEADVARSRGVEEAVIAVLDSNYYETVFVEELTSIQTQLVRSAQLEAVELLSDRGVVNLDLRRLYIPLYERLAADERTKEITQNEVPAHFGVFEVADRTTAVDMAWKAILIAPRWRALSLVLAIACAVGGVFLAERRPTAVVQWGTGVLGLTLIIAIVAFLIRMTVPIMTSTNAAAVTSVYAVTVAPLVSLMLRLALIGAITAAIGAIARLIWPDDWVYSPVADRGSRSWFRRRKGATPEDTSTGPAAIGAPGQPGVGGYGQAGPGAIGYPGHHGQPGQRGQHGQAGVYPGQYPYQQPGWGAYPQSGPYPAQPYGQPATAQHSAHGQHGGHAGQHPGVFGYPVNPHNPHSVGPHGQPGGAFGQSVGPATMPIQTVRAQENPEVRDTSSDVTGRATRGGAAAGGEVGRGGTAGAASGQTPGGGQVPGAGPAGGAAPGGGATAGGGASGGGTTSGQTARGGTAAGGQGAHGAKASGQDAGVGDAAIVIPEVTKED